MNDRDQPAADPCPTTEKPQPGYTELGAAGIHHLCRDILLAIPAEDYDLRARVTELFGRITVLTGKHVVDRHQLRVYKETPEVLQARIEQMQREECSRMLAKHAVQVWKVARADGGRSLELTTQAVIVKPGPVRG